MTKIKRYIMWAVLALICSLAVLSVLGAFYGAQKAKLIFTSLPLGIYWCVLAILLPAGFVQFPRLRHKPALLMVHAGCLLVLAGSMWGSQAGHRLGQRFFGIQKIAGGYMIIPEGHSENRILAADLIHPVFELPFGIKLKDFRIEYYQRDEESIPRLYIRTQQGQRFQIAAEAGKEISLGQNAGKLKVIRTFQNFKIRFENGQKIVTDQTSEAPNPAVQVEIELPDANSFTRYVFERFADFGQAEDGLQLRYITQRPRMIRDYFSDVVVIENGKEVLSKAIEVNHPLHYAGYHFYQHSYDSEAGSYTILSVTSDSGLYVVYGGYWLLALGVLWQFWLRHVVAHIKGRKLQTRHQYNGD